MATLTEKMKSALAALGKEQSVLKQLTGEVKATVRHMTEADPGVKTLLARSAGYAVFPAVGQAAAVIGGAFGTGQVFGGRRLIGYAAVARLTFGVQLGGTTFSQIVVFRDQPALDRFKAGRLAFAASAAAVLVKAGAAATTRYERGVAVFVQPRGGMLIQAAIGGQKLFFRPAFAGRLEPAPRRAATRARARQASSSAKARPPRAARPKRPSARRSSPHSKPRNSR